MNTSSPAFKKELKIVPLSLEWATANPTRIEKELMPEYAHERIILKTQVQ